MLHLEVLDARFGKERVLGGQCLIAATVNEQHEIVHINDLHDVSYGERDGTVSDRVKEIAGLMQGARFNSRASQEIVLEMWEKWTFLASGASSTCLMRATVGDICASPGGTDYVLGVLEECRGIAEAEGYSVRKASFDRSRAMLTMAGSTLSASMLRDIERNGPIEADHIVGDLIRRGREHGLLTSANSFLKIAYAHMKAYEARRARMLAQQ